MSCACGLVDPGIDFHVNKSYVYVKRKIVVMLLCLFCSNVIAPLVVFSTKAVMLVGKNNFDIHIMIESQECTQISVSRQNELRNYIYSSIDLVLILGNFCSQFYFILGDGFGWGHRSIYLLLWAN